MQPPVDQADERPAGWSDRDLALVDGSGVDSNSVRDLEAQLHSAGWAVVRIAGASDAYDATAALDATAMLCALGRPLRIFGDRPLWKSLISDPTRPLHSSGGVGKQDPHIDFVNAQYPPDLVALYCVRPDADGGGASVLAPVDAVLALSDDDRQALARSVFRDGVVDGLDEVGADINPFPVWNPEARLPLRWTGNLLESTEAGPELDALGRLRDEMLAQEIEISLEPGEMLVVNQRRAVHGRRALSPRMSNATVSQRRLLMHGFARLKPEAPAGG